MLQLRLFIARKCLLVTEELNDGNNISRCMTMIIQFKDIGKVCNDNYRCMNDTVRVFTKVDLDC